jgi:hypothetical protein
MYRRDSRAGDYGNVDREFYETICASEQSFVDVVSLYLLLQRVSEFLASRKKEGKALLFSSLL